MESLNTKLQEKIEQIEQAKKDAEDSIKAFRNSQENRAHVLGLYLMFLTFLLLKNIMNSYFFNINF